MSERCAWQVPGGALVRAALGGETVLCLKAQRQGRDYVNHYLVPLAPLPDGRRGMALVYVDPEAPVAATPAVLSVEAAARGTAEIGDVIVNANGRFLKVADTARTERSFAYVDLDSGEVRPRQERAVSAVLTWRLA
jgi:hypothetical protein